jgi:hypothetical protein
LDVDLIPDRKFGKANKSRTKEWRDKTGKTKKARAINMHSKITSLFKVLNISRLFASKLKGSLLAGGQSSESCPCGAQRIRGA